MFCKLVSKGGGRRDERDPPLVHGNHDCLKTLMRVKALCDELELGMHGFGRQEKVFREILVVRAPTIQAGLQQANQGRREGAGDFRVQLHFVLHTVQQRPRL